jgi:alpha-beta hydrolase superfamily lysophospholipase
MAGVLPTLYKDVLAAGEWHVTFQSSARPRIAAATPVIYCHHATGGAFTPYQGMAGAGGATDQAIGAIVKALVLAGHPVIANDQGGPSSWSNQTALDRVDAALARVAVETNCRSDRVLLLGDSMGTTLALNWMRRNAAKVAGVALLLPIPDLAHAHAAAPAPIPANIDTAFSGMAGGYAGQVDAFNPAAHASDYASMPIAFWHSDDDPTADPPTAKAFAAAIGRSSSSMGSAGHAIPAGFDVTAVVNHLLAHV